MYVNIVALNYLIGAVLGLLWAIFAGLQDLAFRKINWRYSLIGLITAVLYRVTTYIWLILRGVMSSQRALMELLIIAGVVTFSLILWFNRQRGDRKVSWGGADAKAAIILVLFNPTLVAIVSASVSILLFSTIWMLYFRGARRLLRFWWVTAINFIHGLQEYYVVEMDIPDPLYKQVPVVLAMTAGYWISLLLTWYIKMPAYLGPILT